MTFVHQVGGAFFIWSLERGHLSALRGHSLYSRAGRSLILSKSGLECRRLYEDYVGNC